MESKKGQMPFGFDAIYSDDGVRILQENKEEQDTINRIKELRSETTLLKNGKLAPMTYSKIKEILEKEGRLNKDKKPSWNTGSIRNILTRQTLRS